MHTPSLSLTKLVVINPSGKTILNALILWFTSAYSFKVIFPSLSFRSIPVVTIVDSLGLTIDKANEINFYAPELAKLATAYVTSNMPKITVYMGHAIGASFVLLGSKALGADVVYATDDSEICALPAESGVAFAWDKYITLEKTRESLVEEWKLDVASPARAAASGEIDDTMIDKELLSVVSAIEKEPFWLAQIQQIYFNDKKEAIITPRIGDHIIELGTVKQIDEKLLNLKTFYINGLSTVGWNKYNKLHIKISNKVICTKR